MKKERHDAITEIMDMLYSLPDDYRIAQFIFNSFKSSGDMFYRQDKEFVESLKKHREEVFLLYVEETKKDGEKWV